MEKNMPSMVDVLNALSDEKALDIFKIIALSNCDSNILITKKTYPQVILFKNG